MPVITNPIVARIAAALIQAGAKWTPIYRKERDANGVPVGGETQVGYMLGKKYKKGVSSILKIDIPGTVLQTDIPRFEGVMAFNCGEILEHDEISIGGVRNEILDVQGTDGLYFVLVLKE